MITMYRQNKLDGAEQHDPEKLAGDFLATLRGEPGYKPSGRGDLESEYRWYLSAPLQGSLTWRSEDWPGLWNALEQRLNALSDDEYAEVLRSLGG